LVLKTNYDSLPHAKCENRIQYRTFREEAIATGVIEHDAVMAINNYVWYT